MADDLRVAVLSVTRDRLAYTKHCFTTLAEKAGVEYDHFVYDNGSADGTPLWLQDEFPVHALVVSEENVGISKAMNELLRIIEREEDPYDVIVKVDNDCELLTENTLHDISWLVAEYGLILSPQVHGLRQPPATIGGTPLSLGGDLVDEKAQIGGIFLAAPAAMYDTFRYNDANPLWGGDDTEVCAVWRANGGRCGYVRGYDINHYRTTDGQQLDDPTYWERKLSEMHLSEAG